MRPAFLYLVVICHLEYCSHPNHYKHPHSVQFVIGNLLRGIYGTTTPIDLQCKMRMENPRKSFMQICNRYYFLTKIISKSKMLWIYKQAALRTLHPSPILLTPPLHQFLIRITNPAGPVQKEIGAGSVLTNFERDYWCQACGQVLQ